MQNVLYWIGRFSPSFLGNSEQENILQTIKHLIQHTVLETQFWSVKYATVTVRYGNISSSMSLLLIQAASDKRV